MLWAFLLATTGIIVLFVFFISKVAQFLGIELAFKTYVLCTIMAVFCNCVVISTAMYYPMNHFTIVLLLVVFSTFIVTFYNQRVLRGQKKKNDLLVAHNSEVAVPRKEDCALEKVLEVEQADVAPPKVELEVMRGGLPKEGADTAVKAVKIVPAEIATVTVVEKEKTDIQLTPLEREGLLKSLQKFSTFEDILDEAQRVYAEKSYHQYIFIMEYALEHCQAEEYLPFLCLELGNVYKNLGFYRHAVILLQRAVQCPVFRNNDASRQSLEMQIKEMQMAMFS